MEKSPIVSPYRRLTWMIRIYSLKLLFSLMASVPLAILTKKLKFKELYVGNLAGASAFFLFAPVLAYLGLGVWSIVLAHIAEQIIITLFYWKCAPFVPSFTFDKRIARNYLSYNGNLFLSSLMAVVITNGDDAVIGRMMGPVHLGFYTIGQQLAQFVMLIPNNTSEILFPVFSGIQENPSRLKRAYLKAFRVTHVFTLPFIGGSIVLAREIVLTLFGEKWLPILPVFYVLCLAVLLQSLISMANPLFCSLNKPHLLKYSQDPDPSGVPYRGLPLRQAMGISWRLLGDGPPGPYPLYLLGLETNTRDRGNLW